MIYKASSLQKKPFNKSTVRVGVESIKVGDYVRCVDKVTLAYDVCRITSIIKIQRMRYELKLSTFETIICSVDTNFFPLDNSHAWTPAHTFDTQLRLCKRINRYLQTPFVLSVKNTGFPDTFYDILTDKPEKAILVDHIARIYG